jgi:eukaryotic-like serine/threonine-protein kinase
MADSASALLLYEAWGEALWGYSAEPRQTTLRALRSCKSVPCDTAAALTFAMIGDALATNRLLADLAHRHPEDTLLNRVSIPLVRSILELKAGRAAASLEAATSLQPFDFGTKAGVSAAYVRGLAYLQMRNPEKAAEEFQSVIQHEGLGATAPERVLAYAQLARSYAAARKSDQSRRAYAHFFQLWKDADPDIPILKQARAEYSKLQ